MIEQNVSLLYLSLAQSSPPRRHMFAVLKVKILLPLLVAEEPKCIVCDGSEWEHRICPRCGSSHSRTSHRIQQNNNKRRSPTEYSEFQRSLCASYECVRRTARTKRTTILECWNEPQANACVRATETASRLSRVKMSMGVASDSFLCLWYSLASTFIFSSAHSRRCSCLRRGHTRSLWIAAFVCAREPLTVWVRVR